MPPSVPRRMERVNSLIREEVAKYLQEYYSHESLGFLTVLTVRTATDLKNATIFISVLGDAATQETSCAALNQAASVIRRAIRPYLSLKIIPNLVFELDHTAESAERISLLLNEVKTEDPIAGDPGVPVPAAPISGDGEAS